jgi:basic membrane protein A
VNKISRKALSGFAVLAASALVLTGCAAAPESDPTVTPVDFKACAVSDEGSWNDKSFNESVYNGLKQAKVELGVQTADAESATAEAFAPNLQTMIDANCDVTIAVGFNLVAAVNEAAKANPTVNFVTVDGWSEGNANLKPINYKMNESSYLAGYLAAAYSTTKIVGTYGGMKIDAVTDFMNGFYYGAKKYEAETGTAVKVLGWDPAKKAGDFMGDFAPNSAVSKTIAAGQIQNGADVIMPVAGEQLGALSEAIKESAKNVVMLGVDSDRALNSPEYAPLLLTSVEKRMTKAVFEIIKDLAAGNAFSGDPYVGTLANDGTGLAPFHEFEGKVSSDIVSKLEELKAGIVDGSIDPTK